MVFSEVPRVLEPDVSGFLKQLRIVCFELPSFLFAHGIDGLHEMAHNVKFIEDKEGIGKALFDDIHIGGPHIATDSLYLLRSLFPKVIKETLQGLSAAVFATPQQAFPCEVVDLSMVDMASLARVVVQGRYISMTFVCIRYQCRTCFKREL